VLADGFESLREELETGPTTPRHELICLKCRILQRKAWTTKHFCRCMSKIF